MAIPLRSWLDLMEREYFSNFLPAGGGAVRFVVSEAEGLQAVSAGLSTRAFGHEMSVIAIDLAVTKLHLLQNVVFAIAAALPWERLLQTRLESLVAQAGYRWDKPGEKMRLAALAESNEVAPHLLQRALTQSFTRAIWQDAALTQDMRHAMIALLEHRLTGDAPVVAAAVMEWLCGTLRGVSALRPAGIGRRIGRQNARSVLMSLCHWVRCCGGAGILLLLDIRQLHRERRQISEGQVYTPAAVMDCYEVMRQLIDDAERFPGLFVVALADPAFLADDPRRSLSQYTALQMRIDNEVRPQHGDNPLAPLVRITP